jgi:peptide/nickel transport system ATP-binding protein
LVAGSSEAPLLEVDGLSVAFGGAEGGVVRAVDGVSFTVGREKLGIVGESGSGKSTVGRAILRLTPPQARVEARRLAFAGIDLMRAGERQMRKIRGRRIAMILQDPKFSLNPVVTVGEQIAETYRLHHRTGRRDAKARALAMLDAVQIREPERVFGLYPHQVSAAWASGS